MSVRLVIDNDDILVNSALALLEAKRRFERIGSPKGWSKELIDVCAARHMFHKEFIREATRGRD